jgi:hypothetical protein
MCCVLLLFCCAVRCMQVIVQTNHMGRWQFKLCDLSATDDSKCQQLQRYGDMTAAQLTTDCVGRFSAPCSSAHIPLFSHPRILVQQLVMPNSTVHVLQHTKNGLPLAHG